MISFDFFLIIVSFLITYTLVPVFRKLAIKFSLVDFPDGKIKLHKIPTPYLGGLAVFWGFFLTLTPFFYLFNQDNFYYFFIGIFFLLVIGLIDDIVSLAPSSKFLGQCIAVLFFLKAKLYLKASIFPWNFNIPISIIWLLFIINAFNLVDVMDGLATTLGICASFSFLIIAVLLNQSIEIVLLSSFLGALSAFLFFNKPLARIYLGDAGSLFLGGFLAGIPFFINYCQYNKNGFLIPILILAIPVFEVISLILVRFYKGIPFYKGSPDHFSFYLQKKAWSKKLILFYVSLLTLIQLIISILFLFNKIQLIALFFSEVVILGFWLYNLIISPQNPIK